MDKHVSKRMRWLKVCGVAVFLAVSLFPAGRPALLTSDSVPMSDVPPAERLSGVVETLQRNSSADTLWLYISYDGMGAQANITESGALPGRHPAEATSLEEWLAGSASLEPRLAIFASDQPHKTEVIDNE